MAKKHISVTNDRVLKALEESRNASRLIEEAMLYYLDALDHDYITKEEVQTMIFDAIRNIEIKNPNYSGEQLGSDISDILGM